MAGAKETPRQKLIGMMYLVLTALLALQVSSEIVKKFELINKSLEHANAQALVGNQNTLEAINKELSGDKAKANILQAAAQVREKSSKTIAELQTLKEELITKTGGYKPGTQEFVNPNAESDVEVFMIGAEGSKNGKGYGMKKKLDDYVDFLKQTAKMDVAPLALAAADIEGLKNDAAQNGKDFAELNFQATPMAAALAVISQKQNEVARYEAEALKKLKGDIDEQIVKVDKIVAMVRPEARVVAAGTKFKADVFMAASASGITPTMVVGGKPLNVIDGMGKVEFTAQGGGFDKDGKATQFLKGEIRYRLPSGEEKVLPINEQYTVVKPVIQVQSASVQALYANCGNDLNINVPALGADYRPSFSASGASVVQGAKAGDVTIIPTGTEVSISVSSGGNMIGTEKFKVRPVPKPAVKPFANGRELNIKMGLDAPYPTSIEMRAVPEEGFAALLPKDARFKVASTEVTLVRSKRPVGSPVRGDDRIGIGGLMSQARPGDKLIIEVKDVKRMNFKGQLIETGVSGGSGVFSVSLN